MATMLSRVVLKVVLLLCVLVPVELKGQTQSGTPVLKIIHFGVGNGDSTLLVLDDGSNSHKPVLSVLIDGGSRNMAATVVIPGIRAAGIEGLDYVIATHKDPDHVGGLYEVLEAISMTGRGAVYERDHKWPTTKDGGLLKAGMPLLVDLEKDALQTAKNKLEIKCVAVNGNVSDVPWDSHTADLDENARSMAFLVTFGKFRYFIGGDLTGGGVSGWHASADVESRVAREVGRITVLRVNHHGSVTSSNSAFLGGLQPIVAVISASPDPSTTSLFHWPSETVLTRLSRLPQLRAVYITGAVDATKLSDQDKKKIHDGKGNITISTTGDDNFQVNEDTYPLAK
jgi:competence protein ComEC